MDENVKQLILAMERLMSNVFGQEEGDPPPFANWTEALHECTNALDNIKGVQE